MTNVSKVVFDEAALRKAVVQSPGWPRIADDAAQARVMPSESALNDLLPGCTGMSTDSIIPLVEQIFAAAGLDYAEDQIRGIAGALGKGQTIKLPVRAI